MTSVLKFMAISLRNQLLARGIERSLADCETIMAAIIDETNTAAADIERRARERTDA